MIKERWIDLPDYEGKYEVSSLGHVRNVKTGKVLLGGEDEFGAPVVYLTREDGRRTKRRISVMLDLFDDGSFFTRPTVGGSATTGMSDGQ